MITAQRNIPLSNSQSEIYALVRQYVDNHLSNMSQTITDQIMAEIDSTYGTAIEKNSLDIKTFTNNEEIQFVKDYYIITSGDTVDINSPVASETGWKYAVLDCVDGDTFTITSTGGQNPRAYCFIDANGNSLRVAASGLAVDDFVVSAPVNSAKIVINAKNDEKSYKGKIVHNIAEDAASAAASQFTKNYINLKPNTFNSTGSNGRTVYFNGNTFGMIGTTGAGTTYSSYLLNKPITRYVASTNTNIATHLTTDDFTPLYFSDNNIALIADISYSGIRLLDKTNSVGHLVVATYNATTGVTVKDLAGGYSMTYGEAKRNVDVSVNITAVLPEIIENKNFALLYQTRIPCVTEEWTLNVRMEPYTYSGTKTAGSKNKPLAYQEARFIATKAYAVNDILVIGNNLYIVTAPIANGGTITPGTNAEYTTIGDLITGILNS